MVLIGRVTRFLALPVGRSPIFIAFFLCLVLSPSSVLAQGTADIAMPSSGLQPLDWCLIFVYAASTIGFGIYYARRQTSTSEYFVGNGKMNPFFVGVSLYATLLSTISYLSMPHPFPALAVAMAQGRRSDHLGERGSRGRRVHRAGHPGGALRRGERGLGRCSPLEHLPASPPID